jgi:hypothetical protein
MFQNNDIIKFVIDYFSRKNNAGNLINKIEKLESEEKYCLEIGKVLFNNGFKIHNFIVTPYNIEIYKNKKFFCEISLCCGEKIMSVNYSSKRIHKSPIEIMNGYIFFIYGEFTEMYNDIVINSCDLLEWPTDISLNELKKMVEWVSSPVEYQKMDLDSERFLKYDNESNHDIDLSKYSVEVSDIGRIRINNIIVKQTVKNGISYVLNNIPVYKLIGNTFLPKPIGFSSQIHHIDNNGCNNNIKNLLRITYEQHASIHLFMWDSYKFEDNVLKNR